MSFVYALLPTTTACACISKTDNYFRYIIIIIIDVVVVRQKYTHAQHQQHTHIPINLVLSHSPASPPLTPPPYVHIIYVYKYKKYTRALFLVHRRRRLSVRAITRETNSDWRMNRLGRTKRVFHSYIIFYIHQYLPPTYTYNIFYIPLLPPPGCVLYIIIVIIIIISPMLRLRVFAHSRPRCRRGMAERPTEYRLHYDGGGPDYDHVV